MNGHPDRERLEELAHGVLDEADPAHAHAASCARCEAIVSTYQREEVTLKRLLAQETPSGSSRRTLLQAAAAVILVIGLSLVFVGRPSRPSLAILESTSGDVTLDEHRAQTGQTVRPGQMLATGRGESWARISLPAGGWVEIRPSTHLAYIAGGVSLESGSIRADISNGPFRVSTPFAEVEVVGTRFAVAADPDSTRVEVERGLLRVIRREDGHASLVGEGHFIDVAPESELAPRDNVIVAPVALPEAPALDLVFVPESISRPGVREPAYGPDDPDRRKRAKALYLEGFRLETEEPRDPFRAIVKYKKAYAAALNETDRELAARSLIRIASCKESLGPDSVVEAQAVYRQLATDFSDLEKWRRQAEEKLRHQGVDVYLKELVSSLKAWRVPLERTPAGLTRRKEEVWQRIEPLGPKAVPGLLAGLGHEDPVIRDFAADRLVEVADEEAVAAVISRLADDRSFVRAGAGSALRKILDRYNEAAEIDRRASKLEADLDFPVPGSGPPAKRQAALRDEVRKLRQTAKRLRGHLPDHLSGDAAGEALRRILADESASPQSRRQAAHAASRLDAFSTAMVDAFVRGMGSDNRNVREAFCRAVASGQAVSGESVHRLADALMHAVRHEPAKDPEPEWANDEAVRHAAAEALGRLRLVKTFPSLLEALDDNDVRVREAAHRAICAVSGQTLAYEADASREERGQSRAVWKEWWENTAGTDALVDRFRAFRASWNSYPPARIYQRELFLKAVRSRAWAWDDPGRVVERAERSAEKFHLSKDAFVLDAVELHRDVGDAVLDRLLAMLGDEKLDEATRLFISECSAAITGARERLGDRILALCFLPSDKLGEEGREMLLLRGLESPVVVVREASAFALGRTGDQEAVPALLRAADDPELRVRLAALAGLEKIAPASGEAREALGKILAAEREDAVREYAVNVLGAAGDPAALDPLLIRSRQDTARSVRAATAHAIRSIGKSDPAIAVLIDEKRRTLDRSGAALALGDLAKPELAETLMKRLVDPNPPRVLRDSDAGVRIKIAEALGSMGNAAHSVVGQLVSCMADEGEHRAVRDSVYEALKAILSIDPDADGSPDGMLRFSAEDPRDRREESIKRWLEALRAGRFRTNE